MKTQIVPRIILVAFALIFSINNNNGSFKQPAFAFNHKANNYSSSHEENKTATHNNENSVPYLPQTDGHHDFDCFDFKHHEKRIFWKCIANKIFATIYHVILLMPVILESLKQIFL
ncbi:MAG TPA: hypothetical protein VHB70_07010 [Parafilimonas sp.]|nr:hypothetical protein [Parafilimonas sp.]